MAFLFRPPARTEQVRLPTVPNPVTDYDSGRAGYGLMAHVDRGLGPPVAVLITGTLVTEHTSPTQEQIAAATWHYLGGHEYIVSATEKALLEGAGYVILTV